VFPSTEVSFLLDKQSNEGCHSRDKPHGTDTVLAALLVQVNCGPPYHDDGNAGDPVIGKEKRLV